MIPSTYSRIISGAQVLVITTLFQLPFQGVPIRVEIGPKDIESSQVVTVCRDTGVKKPIKIESAVETIRTLLDDMQKRMFEK